MSVRSDGAQLLVRPEDWSVAESVMKAIEEEIEQLFARAERHADEEKVEEELACYERLGRLRPGDALVHYNRAAILRDLDRREAAADAFMESAPLLARDPQLAQYVGEVAKHLEELRASYPKPELVAHALAMIAMHDDDSERARGLYTEIVAADESDASAHAALGRLLYESGDDDEAAAKHLARYLALEPDAPDRESIEQALEELRSDA